MAEGGFDYNRSDNGGHERRTPPPPRFPRPPAFSPSAPYPYPNYMAPGASTPPPPGYDLPGHVRSSEFENLMKFQADQNQQFMRFMFEQNQAAIKQQQEQMITALKNQKLNETKVKCPRWEKDENVKTFTSRLKRWDKVERGPVKYLQLLEALQDSGRKQEKRRLELEEENKVIDPDDDEIITTVIDKLEKWFGKTKIDEASEAWKNFKDIKRSNGENINDFLLRFETIESRLRCSTTVNLPNQILALQLLDSVDVNSDQRRSILVNVKIENNDTVYEDMKSSIRLLKGVLVEKEINIKQENTFEDEVNFTKNDSFRRSRPRSRSKSKQRFEERSFDRTFDKGRNEQRRSLERSYSSGRSPYRHRSYSRNRDENNRRYGEDNKYENYRRRERSHDKYSERDGKKNYEQI